MIYITFFATHKNQHESRWIKKNLLPNSKFYAVVLKVAKTLKSIEQKVMVK